MNRLHILAFTHKQFPLETIGKLHLNEDEFRPKLIQLKNNCRLDELMMLATCNRVEFIFCTPVEVTPTELNCFLSELYPHLDANELAFLLKNCSHYSGTGAVKHLFEVTSSVDALVIGEREIITQVRLAFEKCKNEGLCGDYIRVAVQAAIITAKKVYTQTALADKPVSVVSLAYRKLMDAGVKSGARFILVGAGQTNALMARFLKKHDFHNFVVFNRSLDKARQLATILNGKAHQLNELPLYRNGFDVLITCTGATDYLIEDYLYTKLLNGEKNQKIVIDLSVPHNVNPEICKHHAVKFIDVKYLQELANENLKVRKSELQHCREIIAEEIKSFQKAFRARQVELAMQDVPRMVKKIHQTALTEVFTDELTQLDAKSRATLDKIMQYIEKKYISVPMKMAREIMLQ